jgi:chromosome partitioning protein
MARVIAVVNQKGGVGKTTTAVNLGAYLAAMGKFVLLIDIDPQANATSGLGSDPRAVEQGVYHSLIGAAPFRSIIVNTPHTGYRLAPATPELAGARIELVSQDRREFVLQQAVLEVRHDFDYILIDCPPSLDLLTVNGLVAADEVLIPVQAEYLALEGLGQLLTTLELIKGQVHPNLKILGAVVTMFDKRNRLSQQVHDDLRANFPHTVLQTVIPRNVRLTEAPSYGQSILSYDPRSQGGRAYEELARELLAQENQNYL